MSIDVNVVVLDSGPFFDIFGDMLVLTTTLVSLRKLCFIAKIR